jgi:hypothetical protein
MKTNRAARLDRWIYRLVGTRSRDVWLPCPALACMKTGRLDEAAGGDPAGRSRTPIWWGGERERHVG